jgi:hypothetical protein
MISPITPWTAVGPDHYLRASHQGFEQGAAIATAQNRTKEVAAQRALQQSELDQREQLARWEMGQRQQQAAEALRARENDTAATLALRREYEMGRLADADVAAQDRLLRLTQPEIRTGPNGAIWERNSKTGAWTNPVTASETSEELKTITQDGESFQQRGGKWYHIPRYKPPTDTITEVTPATSGEEAVPGTPATSGLFGLPFSFLGAKPAIPGTPAIPGRPEIRRTRRVPVDLSEEKGAFPLLPQGGTNAPTTDVDGLIRENQAAVAGAQAQRAEAQKTLQDVQGKAKRVRVTGPGGKKGTVEQGDTLPEGWKLAE